MSATVRATMSFPRDARLLAGVDFARVFDGGRRAAHPLLALHWHHPGSADARPRLGLAVSRKVDPRAVVRNRIKRRLRESFRRLRPRLRAGDYVVVARRAAVDASHAELTLAFEGLLRRAGALPDHGSLGTMPGSPSSPTTERAARARPEAAR